jgi:hypothetical protein
MGRGVWLPYSLGTTKALTHTVHPFLQAAGDPDIPPYWSLRSRNSVLHLLEHHPVMLEDLPFEDLQVGCDLVAAHPFAEVAAEELRQQ